MEKEQREGGRWHTHVTTSMPTPPRTVSLSLTASAPPPAVGGPPSSRSGRRTTDPYGPVCRRCRNRPLPRWSWDLVRFGRKRRTGCARYGRRTRCACRRGGRWGRDCRGWPCRSERRRTPAWSAALPWARPCLSSRTCNTSNSPRRCQSALQYCDVSVCLAVS